jgi:hypothetical protein
VGGGGWGRYTWGHTGFRYGRTMGAAMERQLVARWVVTVYPGCGSHHGCQAVAGSGTVWVHQLAVLEWQLMKVPGGGLARAGAASPGCTDRQSVVSCS